MPTSPVRERRRRATRDPPCTGTAIRGREHTGHRRRERAHPAPQGAPRTWTRRDEAGNPRAGLGRKPTAVPPPGEAGRAPGAGPGQRPAVVGDALRSPGLPLEPSARASMEARFQRDFANVRIHPDAAAADAAGARAYTIGRDIVFAPGEYAPGTAAGSGSWRTNSRTWRSRGASKRIRPAHSRSWTTPRSKPTPPAHRTAREARSPGPQSPAEVRWSSGTRIGQKDSRSSSSR